MQTGMFTSQVSLSTKAAPVDQLCSLIFDDTTISKIGARALCSVPAATMLTAAGDVDIGSASGGDALLVRFMAGAGLVAGSDRLALREGQALLVSDAGHR